MERESNAREWRTVTHWKTGVDRHCMRMKSLDFGMTGAKVNRLNRAKASERTATCRCVAVLFEGPTRIPTNQET